MLRLMELVVVSGIFCAAGAGQAAELSCSADQFIERINRVAAKTNPDLVFAKRNCTEGEGFTRCSYRNSVGPGISQITKAGSQNVQTIVVVDPRGFSPTVGVYISLLMEALDSSLAGDARRRFYNQLLQEFASGSEKGGVIEKSSGELKYSLSKDDKLAIFGVSSAK
jgi:hypothetical protein